MAELKKTRKTLLHHRAALVRFVADDDIDNASILSMVTIESPYTTQRALSFERQQLSEKEEFRFNRKFAAFVKGLIAEMNNKCIDYCLELLVRAYCADTYNADELLFLMLPFRRYIEQIRIISKNTASPLAQMKSYSIRTIAQVLLRDARSFFSVVEYFKHYKLLHGFLDRLMDEIIEILRGSGRDYLSEMYQILVYLTEQGEERKALEIYHRMRTYLDSDDFVSLLARFFAEDEVRMVDEAKKCLGLYETAHRDASGRLFLKDEQKLSHYINFLESRKLVPAEFTIEEYSVLKKLCMCDKASNDQFIRSDGQMDDNNCKITDQNIRCIESLYKEMGNKIKLTKLLADSPQISILYRYMNTEDRMYMVSRSSAPILELFNEANHGILVKNMRRDVFEKHYEDVLRACIDFVSFDAGLFGRFSMCECPSSTAKRNLIRLAAHTGHSLVSELLGGRLDDSIFLSYLLLSDHAFEAVDVKRIIEAVVALGTPSLVSDAAVFLLKRGDAEAVRSFCSWAQRGGMERNIEPLVNGSLEKLDGVFLWEFLLKTESPTVLRSLLDRNPDTVRRLYDLPNLGLVRQAAAIVGTGGILIDHPETLRFVEHYHAELDDAHSIIDYALARVQQPGAVNCLLCFYGRLIEFRGHSQWPFARAIIIEGLEEKSAHQRFIEHILKNIAAFSGDQSLFSALLAGPVVLAAADIEGICEAGAPAADFIEEALLRRLFEPLPLIPSISPLLIKYKKSSVAGLFAEYCNLMYAYARNVLADYPEIMGVLLGVDPRHSLRELTDCIRRSLPSGADPEKTTRCLALLTDIMRQKECRSREVMRSLAQFLCDDAYAGGVPSDMPGLFVRFYVRSLGAAGCKEVSDLVYKIAAKDNEQFNGMMLDTIEHNWEIYTAVFEAAVSRVSGCVAGTDASASLLLISKYIDCQPGAAAKYGPELFKSVFGLQNARSAAAIASLCRADAGLITDVNDYILGMIKEKRAIEYSLDVLTYLFKNVGQYAVNRGAVMPLACVLSEGKDEASAEHARLLYESLQFLE